MTPPDRWADLNVRLASAAVMIALGVFEVYEGGILFLIGVLLLVTAMIWEVAELTADTSGPFSIALGVLAAVCLFVWTLILSPWGAALLAIPSLGLLLTRRGDRRLMAIYALAVMVAATGFLTLRGQGAGVFVWLVLVVVASDTLGYFAGRLIGGPKFWPRVSPKKTWSGTIAGWIGATIVGAVFVWYGFPPGLLLLSPLVAFAGQIGDIAESWLKRRAGVKDSSGLIPGHGGVLDRFDALIGATLAVQALTLFLPGVA
jgi:phosphatidate cytidylyltransferase